MKNKIVKFAIMALASFVVINVGMFFFLKMTQPKMGARADSAATAQQKAGADSLARASAGTAPADAAKSLAEAAKDTTKTLPAARAEGGSSNVTPVAASVVAPEPSPMPSPPQPSNTISSVDSTPVASQPDTSQSAGNLISNMNDADTKEMAKLAKLLEAVKPAEAASIAEQLSVDQIVALVMKMKDRNAGKMLAALPPDQAARVALKMSQMGNPAKGKP